MIHLLFIILLLTMKKFSFEDVICRVVSNKDTWISKSYADRVLTASQMIQINDK